MKKLLTLFFTLVCVSNVFAIDLSESMSLGGLSFNYPQKGYKVKDKGFSDGQYYFILDNNNVTGSDYAIVNFRYGKNQIINRSNDMHVFCNERLEVCKSSFENNKQIKDFSAIENYIEDNESYSIGITRFTSSIYGNKIFGQIIMVVTPSNLLILIMQGTKEMYLTEFEEISRTIHMDQVPNLRITDIYQKYDAYIKQSKESNTNITTNSQALQSSTPTIAFNSPVDSNIPKNFCTNDKTFAIIIANEHYQEEASVLYATNDGKIFCQYCENTLGIPSRNIHYRQDATLNNIRKEVNWLSQVCEAYNGEASVIFYYAGHGIPDESNKSAYLLPVDGNGTDATTGYKLDELYTTLGNMPATHITVFMDACFSGSQRGSGMLASARGIALKSKAGVPQGNMVVFSAAQGDETAYPNNDEGHGMFTYYLLKKLQETEGDVTLKDLGDYITTNVRQQSIVLNSKSQTPCVTPASAVADSWQSWKLK